VMGLLITSLLQIYHESSSEKNVNRLTFDMAMSLWPHFFGPPYTPVHRTQLTHVGPSSYCDDWTCVYRDNQCDASIIILQ